MAVKVNTMTELKLIRTPNQHLTAVFQKNIFILEFRFSMFLLINSFSFPKALIVEVPLIVSPK
jgi:hypothetical protein